MADDLPMPGNDPQPGSTAHSGGRPTPNSPDPHGAGGPGVPGGADVPGVPGGAGGSAMERLYDALHRSPVRRLREGRVIGGVASGLARHFGLDPVLVRVAFVVLGMLLGIGVSLYLLAWFLLPDEFGSLALQRAARDHDTGSIVLGVFAGLSLLNAPGGESSGVWWTLVSLLVVGGIVFFLMRSRGPRATTGRGSDGAGPQTHHSVPDPVYPTHPDPTYPTYPGVARGHSSPTRRGDTSVFDPVTGRWVPAVQGALPPVVGSGTWQPGPAPGSSPATGGHADHDWSRPAAPESPAPRVAPPAPRSGIGTAPTLLVLLGAAIVGVGAAWIAQTAALGASAVVVGAAVALAFLSAVVVVLSLRGRRARPVAVAVLVLLPFAAGVATFQRATPDGAGFSIQVGPR